MTTNDQQETYDRMEAILAQLATVDTRLRSIEVRKDKRIQAITDQFAPQIDPLVKLRDELVEAVAKLFVENEDWLTAMEGKTAVFRSATMKSHTSPGALVVDDEDLAIGYLRKRHMLRAFTRQAKLTLDKVALKKRPELVAKIPGVRLEAPEFLSIRLFRTKIELKENLKPYRRQIA